MKDIRDKLVGNTVHHSTQTIF